MGLDNSPATDISHEGDSSISSINQVQAIDRDRAMWITSRDEVAKYVETPLLQACLDLWDKNIRTLSTTANSKDIQTGLANITIDYDSLSDANKLVAQELGEIMKGYTTLSVSINYPISRETVPSELSSRALESARLFKKQKARWIPSYTLDQLKRLTFISPDNHAADNPEYWKPAGFYFDAGSGKYFLSQEHFEKTLEEIEE